MEEVKEEMDIKVEEMDIKVKEEMEVNVKEEMDLKIKEEEPSLKPNHLDPVSSPITKTTQSCIICLGALNVKMNLDELTQGQGSSQARAPEEAAGVVSGKILASLCRVLGIGFLDSFYGDASIDHLFCQNCFGMLELVRLSYLQLDAIQNSLRTYQTKIEGQIQDSHTLVQGRKEADNVIPLRADQVRNSLVLEIQRLRSIDPVFFLDDLSMDDDQASDSLEATDHEDQLLGTNTENQEQGLQNDNQTKEPMNHHKSDSLNTQNNTNETGESVSGHLKEFEINKDVGIKAVPLVSLGLGNTNTSLNDMNQRSPMPQPSKSPTSTEEDCDDMDLEGGRELELTPEEIPTHDPFLVQHFHGPAGFTGQSSFGDQSQKVKCPECGVLVRPDKHGPESCQKKRVITRTKIKHYSCPLCPRLFKRRPNLEDHKRHKHGKELGLESRTCPECLVVFLQKTRLMSHIKTHNPEAEFKFNCVLCEFKTDSKHNFNKHVVIHVEDKHLQCSDCPMKFKRESDLARHSLLHLKKWEFECPVCGKRCLNETGVKGHWSKSHIKKFGLQLSEYLEKFPTSGSKLKK